jgi:ribonucleoside-triphosphate reductase
MDSALPTLYQQQIHIRHYARWNEEEGRRETWEETVDRYVNQIVRQTEKYGDDAALSLKERAELRDSILSTRVLPSMRCLMTAGPALERDNVAAFNCAYLAVNRPRAFSEAMYILMCGTGVGFSVERQEIAKLPEVPDELYPTDTTIVVSDSRVGWATAYNEFISLLYAGKIPNWDTSKLRPAGARLKTFGGRASGPGPLEDLFRYTVATFKKAVGRKLNSIEAHGLMCKVGDIVVVGGVRRSALISLSNPSDERMAHAKSGNWRATNPEFELANNSAAWTETPDVERFLRDQWLPLIESKSGERGIINRKALQAKAKSTGRREWKHDFGTNPCGEIILRDCEFCNLTEVVARPGDSFEDLIEKVRQATILGVIQSTFTDFRYLSGKWQKNCEEERLLGVSITGVVDNPILNGSRGMDELQGTLHALKHVAIDTAAVWAERFDINISVAITCNKPSGTASKLAFCGSGINEWHAPYFINRQRANKIDPTTQVMIQSGIPYEDDMMDPDNKVVFSFPMKAPEGAITRHDMPALKKLDLWLAYAEHWCEHNPSTTINVKDDEWLEAGAFVHKHFDRMAGVTFFPFSDHIYQQAPLEEITEDHYHELVAKMPESINWDLLKELEIDDQTENAKELACVAGACEIPQ